MDRKPVHEQAHLSEWVFSSKSYEPGYEFYSINRTVKVHNQFDSIYCTHWCDSCNTTLGKLFQVNFQWVILQAPCMSWNSRDRRTQLIQIDDIITIFPGSFQLFPGLFAFFLYSCLQMLIYNLRLSDLLFGDFELTIDTSQIINWETLFRESSM